MSVISCTVMNSRWFCRYSRI